MASASFLEPERINEAGGKSLAVLTARPELQIQKEPAEDEGCFSCILSLAFFFPRQTSNKCVIHAISKKTEQGKATERERERDNEMQTLLEYFFSFPLPSVYFILVFFGA